MPIGKQNRAIVIQREGGRRGDGQIDALAARALESAFLGINEVPSCCTVSVSPSPRSAGLPAGKAAGS